MNDRVEKLTQALMAEQPMKIRESDVYPPCFACGAHRTLRFGRFCSEICVNAYDAGLPGHEQDWLRTKRGPWRVIAGPALSEIELRCLEMRNTANGTLIRCGGCQREFESRGLKFCSDACSRLARQREEDRASMAEVGMEPPAPKRQCQECGAPIPKWTKGKSTPITRRFCSRKCQQRASSRNPSNRRANDEKVPINIESAATPENSDRGVEWAIRVNRSRIVGPREVLEIEMRPPPE